jgi:hypothetical protein
MLNIAYYITTISIFTIDRYTHQKIKQGNIFFLLSKNTDKHPIAFHPQDTKSQNSRKKQNLTENMISLTCFPCSERGKMINGFLSQNK